MYTVKGRWVDSPCWHFLPLLLEEDDRNCALNLLETKISSFFPETRKILGGFEHYKAVSFSKLDAGGRIKLHSHEKPFVTLALCLQGDADCKTRVGTEWASCEVGKCLAFDYTYSHEVINRGSTDRLVLLVLVPKLAFE